MTSSKFPCFASSNCFNDEHSKFSILNGLKFLILSQYYLNTSLRPPKNRIISFHSRLLIDLHFLEMKEGSDSSDV
jgi:hypothetical protein